LNQKNHELAFSGYGAQPPYPKFWETYHGDNAFKTGPDGKRTVVVDTNNVTMTADPALDVLIDKQRLAETEEEVQRLSWQLTQLIHDRACTIPAWEAPNYRYLCWRWLQWPKTGNARESQQPLDEKMYWIDEDLKAETKQAREEGRSYGEVLRVFDKYRKP
jgi:microcin C transport system substrate-binding protein